MSYRAHAHEGAAIPWTPRSVYYTNRIFASIFLRVFLRVFARRAQPAEGAVRCASLLERCRAADTSSRPRHTTAPPFFTQPRTSSAPRRLDASTPTGARVETSFLVSDEHREPPFFFARIKTRHHGHAQAQAAQGHHPGRQRVRAPFPGRRGRRCRAGACVSLCGFDRKRGRHTGDPPARTTRARALLL